MEVIVAGGHGKIGLRLLRLLAGAGHTARGMIRDPAQVDDLEAAGAAPVVCDLEAEDPGAHLGQADAIVFAAGAGPGSGDARKQTVDLGGAVKLVEAAERLGVGRFVMVSAMGAGDPEAGPESMRPYLRAKGEADRILAASRLEWTVVRPGALTDAPGTGRVAVAPSLLRRGEVTRDDVALVLLEVLQGPAAIRVGFDLLAGHDPVREALRAL